MFQEVEEGFRPPSEDDDKTRTYLQQDWRRWVRALFPNHVSDEDGDGIPFAKHHARFWNHLWGIRPGISPPPALYGWPRGQAKSTSMEMGCVAIGARRIRPYALYLCGLQEQADDHVGNIKDMIANSTEISRLYPDLARRALGKYGHAEGWNRNRLATASGFTVDAIGLDTASARGKKFKIHRPGLIILDDIDDGSDSLATVVKKLDALRNRILPTGAEDLAVIGGQNMIHPNSTFSLLFGVASEAAKAAVGEVDLLADRMLDGPIPAVEDLEYEQLPTGTPGGFPDRPRFVITGGRATWAGMDLERCQKIVDTEGMSAFLRERQHVTEAPPGGMFDHLVFERRSWDAVPWAAMEQVVVWVDPAVTNTDSSDSHGIQADGRTSDGRIYRIYSWEGRTSPEKSLRRAILKAVELGALTVGVETDQGGDTWASTYREAARSLVQEGLISQREVPAFRWAKAGAVPGSKVHRASLMLADYERGRFVHVIGTHEVLERALKRFPKTKPLDLVDCAYWSWHDLEAGVGQSASSQSDSAFGGFGAGFGEF